VVEITPERAKALKLPTANGVEVVNVEENSAASRATIRNGDVILELNKEKVESVEDFVGAIAASSPGKKLALTVWREGSKRFLTATLENQRASGVSTFSSSSAMSQTFDIMPLPAPMIGIDGEPLTQQLAQYFRARRHESGRRNPESQRNSRLKSPRNQRPAPPRPQAHVLHGHA
jgi:membrane-associated protease RseP (regulator of RpoE activity)